MKKTIFQLVLILINCTFLFAQESKPVAKGLITVSSGLNNEAINLRIEGNGLVFTNIETNSGFNFLLEPKEFIEEGDENVIHEQNKYAVHNLMDIHSVDTLVPKKQIQKLEFVNSYNILKNQQKLSPDEIRGVIKTNTISLDKYNTGKALVDIGNVALGAGIGFIIGGGLSNLNNASNTPSDTYYSSKPRGSPVFIVTGIVLGCLSIPLKLAGRSSIKESIELYNRNPYTLSKTKDINLVLFTKNNSVGLCYKF